MISTKLHPPSDPPWPGYPHCPPPAPGVLTQRNGGVAFGGKDDSGKIDPGLLYEGCANALHQVVKVLDGGAKKYAADSWKVVPDGINRYRKAFNRHLQEVNIHGLYAVNPDFGLLHIDHMITDLLFIRELMHKERNAPTTARNT